MVKMMCDNVMHVYLQGQSDNEIYIFMLICMWIKNWDLLF